MSVAPPGTWEERTLDVDGVPTYYLEAGQGDTLVLIHGALTWCSAELTYGAVIGPLSRHLRVVAVDVPGFGLTPGRAPEHFPAAGQGAFLVRFLRRLGGPVDLAGNSHGGWLVQYIAHEAPDLVRRLVIINSLNGTSFIPADYPLPRDPEQPPSLDEVRAYLRAYYFHPEPVTDARVRRTHDLWHRNFEFARARRQAIGWTPEHQNRNLTYRGAHISERAGDLPMPVLLTWSRENQGASPADAVAFLNRLRRGELHVLTGARHHVMTEYPQRWTEIVTTFLSTVR